MFYVWPKNFVLFIYFKLLRNRNYLRSLFERVINDTAYVIKHYKDSRVSLDNEYVTQTGQSADWFKKGFYENNEYTGWFARGVFLPRICDAIEAINPISIVDLGCSNGVRIDFLAEKYPKKIFYGLDFSTTEAMNKNRFGNVSYHSGYPLDILDNLPDEIDLLFSTSTMVLVLPLELEAYLEKLNKKVKNILIVETNVNGYKQKNDGKLWSKHMDYGIGWCHNYSGYLKKYGYEVTIFERLKHDHPSRSDHYLINVCGKRMVEK